MYVLAQLLRNSAFVDQVAPVLCVNPIQENTRYPTSEFWRDFETTEINGLYACILKHREIRENSQSGVGPDLLEMMLYDLAMAPHGPIGPDQVEGALDLFRLSMQLDISESHSLVRLGFLFWLRRRRMTLVVSKGTTSTIWDPSQIKEEIAIHFKEIDRLLVQDSEAFVAYDQVQEPPAVDLIPSGLRACDDSLDGGFGRGEFSLIISPSGGGKTTFAIQLAAHFSLLGHKVLFITTEEPPSELIPRIISNTCGILYGRLRRGMERANLKPEEKERSEKLKRVLGTNLFFADWSKDRAKSIRANLNTEIDRFLERHHRLDVVIFDWIGGALGALAGRDQHELRRAYQDTGDALAELARKIGIVVIGFSQAAIGTTRIKKNIGQDDIAECKTLGRKATNVIGISALPDTTDEEGANKARIQYLYVSKARKSAGGLRRFLRKFEYQRFVDP